MLSSQLNIRNSNFQLQILIGITQIYTNRDELSQLHESSLA